MFKDEPDLPLALEICKQPELELEPLETSYFQSREIVVPAPRNSITLKPERLLILGQEIGILTRQD